MHHMNKIYKLNLNKGLRKKRNRARVIGTSDKPRLAVFRSNKFTYIQIIDDAKGHTLASASTKEISKKAKKSELAKMLGLLIAEKAKKAGIKSVVFSRSHYRYHGRVKAVAEGAREGGLKF